MVVQLSGLLIVVTLAFNLFLAVHLDVNMITQSHAFFRAFNAIYSKVGRFSSEDVILSLIRSKCIPILLYCMEVCPLISRQKHSLEFSVTRIFMKLFRTSSSLVVRECQINFGFLPIESQLVVRTANFLQKYVASENSLCLLFNKIANHQLNLLFTQFGNNVKSAQQLSVIINNLFYNSSN